MSARLKNNRISETDFLSETDSVLFTLLSSGTPFSTDELQSLLKEYKELAWKKKDRREFRIKYYKHLINSAERYGQGGYAMFFAEKLSQELKKADTKNHFEFFVKIKLYVANRNYPKVIDLYEHEKVSLNIVKETKGHLGKDIENSLELLKIMANIVYSYLKEENYQGAQKAVEHSSSINQQIQKSKAAEASEKLLSQLVFNFINIAVAVKTPEENAENLLKEQENLINQNRNTLGSMAKFMDTNLFNWKLRYFLNARMNDSAAVYIHQLEKSPVLSPNFNAIVNKYKAELAYNRKDYKTRSELLGKTIEELENELTILSGEMNDLLYAHTEAEFNQKALKESEKSKKNRLIIIIIISSSGLFTAIIFYLNIRRKNEETKQRIYQLNDMVSFQIATMEEVKYQAMIEEQQRLGKELHDDIAATIAGIRHQVELLQLDNEIPEQKESLHSIADQLNKSYQQIRQKSHNWHNNTDKSLELSFEKHIRQLIDNALPDNHYTKQIDIDKDVMQYVSLNVRIELLRIIQEAVVNIIKHSKAQTISMLFYEDQQNLLINISDDGIGFNADKINYSQSLGLKSMQERIREMAGKISFRSDKNGTEIIIVIPHSFTRT